MNAPLQRARVPGHQTLHDHQRAGVVPPTASDGGLLSFPHTTAMNQQGFWILRPLTGRRDRLWGSHCDIVQIQPAWQASSAPKIDGTSASPRLLWRLGQGEKLLATTGTTIPPSWQWASPHAPDMMGSWWRYYGGETEPGGSRRLRG